MKFNSLTIDELNIIQEKLKKENYYEEYIITHIDNPSGRIKFKDTRKISIGISKKDIMSYRCKKKSAFYNCFVLILRMKIEDTFKEFHVKVFNTGKLEIPGVQNEDVFNIILENILKILQPYVEEKLDYKKYTTETVLINSNFNCGFYINREVFHDILKFKYNIQSIYDPCSYPGIQCKYKIKDSEISFMIFRTGSVLIVGKCENEDLYVIYNFIKNIFEKEFMNVYEDDNETKDKKIKQKIKKILYIEG
jgi:TATA-box binding protein (TBP) (component of TFIID and TFIIIB)